MLRGMCPTECGWGFTLSRVGGCREEACASTEKRLADVTPRAGDNGLHDSVDVTVHLSMCRHAWALEKRTSRPPSDCISLQHG